MKIRCNVDTSLQHESKVLPDGRIEDIICLQNIVNENEEEVVITAEWEFPILDITGRWHPACRFDRTLKADWCYGEKSMSSISAPVITFFNEKGENRGTYAVSEALKEVRMQFGVHEENGMMKCIVYIHVGKLDEDDYAVRILSDVREIPYEKAIKGVSEWWEKSCGFLPAYVPKDARDAMYSFWYSYHQEFTDEEIEAECRRAKELGFGTVIVDDGWQTDDTNRGYGYCGDWEVAEKKIKNIKQHIQNVHDMGMKYLLWFSVPYVGMNSKMWKLFSSKLIGVDEEQKTGILDIRYPEVRTYLKNIYIKAVKEWGLDGLKLDFIDEFYERKDTPKPNDDMDCVCLQIALDKLLSETMEELKKINPEILIEFRQRYIGPAIRKYGNMLRVGDCPESGLTNRVSSVDLRLLSGKTAVHSDMIMWHRDEKPEIAALQLINCLFSTIQFSVRLEQMNEGQKKMVRNYMAFMKKYRTLLQETPIEAKEPQNLYPEIRVKNETTEIVALYSANRVVEIDSEKEQIIIVNGTQADKIFVQADETKTIEVIQKDCYGNILNQYRKEITGIECINCTTGGRIKIEK